MIEKERKVMRKWKQISRSPAKFVCESVSLAAVKQRETHPFFYWSTASCDDASSEESQHNWPQAAQHYDEFKHLSIKSACAFW